jgi:hypothetical protein
VDFSKFVSRKLLVTLLTNIFALVLAFGGKITPEQTAAIIGVVNSVYLTMQSVQNAVSKAS